jgi:hypothetical protein
VPIGTQFALDWQPGFEWRHEEWPDVLKITGPSRKNRTLTIKLEGQLLAPWVSTVRDLCTKRDRRRKRTVLDLADVTYIDAAGAGLLRELMHEGIEIVACSSFVAELLHFKKA